MSNYIGQDIILILKSLISVNLQAMSSTGEYKFSPEGSLGVWSPPSLLSRHYVLSSKRPARAWLVLLKLQRRKRRTRPWKTTLWPRVLLLGLFFCTPPCREISSQSSPNQPLRGLMCSRGVRTRKLCRRVDKTGH